MKISSTHRSRSRGFTITEILIAMSISVAIGGAATWFLMEGTRASLKATNTTLTDLSQWSIFTAISVDSKVANGMAVYSTFTEPDLADHTKRRNDNERGHVLILTRSTQAPGSRVAMYEQITGYVYASNTKTLRKFTYSVSNAEKGIPTGNPASLEKILLDNFANFAFRDVGEGLVSVDSGGVFLVRQKGESGLLTIESQLDAGNKQVSSKKLIEAAFFIRG